MFTLNDVLTGNEGKMSLRSETTPDAAQIFPSAHHDSRQVGKGDLFIAIKGARVDGHRFIPEVARAGAGAALCVEACDDVPPDFLQIVVPDVVTALHNTAHVRATRRGNTILMGITGSNGKTSTKEAAAAVLSRSGPTLKTFASYNNEIGYPLTLLRLEEKHRFAVLEMGAQWVGELAWLCKTIAQPDWSLITTVGAAHLEYFLSPERVALAKSELVEGLSAEGMALLNYDDLNVRDMRAQTQARVLYYGLSEEAEVRGSDLRGDELLGHSFALSYGGQTQRVQLHLPGRHGVMIALAGAAAGYAAGMPLEEVCAALETLTPAAGRCEIKAGPNGSTLIDDTYNANRQSIIAIIRAMRSTKIAPGGKRWAVLGDILELGEFSREEHVASGAVVAGNVDYLLAIGAEARYFIEGAIQAGMPEAHTFYFKGDPEHVEELEEAKRAAADLLKQRVHSEDLVLLKGSRGIHIETMLAMLT
jgi:UDP-N-acetylmuramoyl-tripeptide--D-alanyl-D-alanine ligase